MTNDRRSWVGRLVLGVAIVFAGCGGSQGDDGPDGDGDVASGDGDDGTGGSSSDPEINPNPILCGGAYRSPCAAEKLCQYDSTCGTVGDCIPRPDGCDSYYEPVCGCDGNTYENACESWTMGVAVQSQGECGEAETMIACGPHHCQLPSYCIDKGEDAVGDRFICAALPEECGGTPDCSCITDVASCFGYSTCMQEGGAVTHTCD
jgi:hypothetical protein